MDAIVLFGGMILLIMIGLPIGYALGLSAIMAFTWFTTKPNIFLAQTLYYGLDSFVLLAIPFFMLAGYLMGSGGVAKRLVNVADALVGHVTGGLGLVSILTSTFFGAITGSGTATASAVGTIMIPSMTEKKYTKQFSAILIASAGVIGIIIPPSIPFVVYGVAANVSVGEMFLAGIFPGLLLSATLMIGCYIISRKHGFRGRDHKAGINAIIKSLKEGIWAIFAPVIILGGIYSGIFTPTESAVVACIYTIIVGMFIYKELTWRGLIDALYKTVVLNGVLSFIMAFSAITVKFLSMQGIPEAISTFLHEISDSKIVILLLINIILLFVGMLIDIIPAILIFTPIFLPILTSYGVDPIQVGVMMSVNLGVGFVTPPYGCNMFVGAAIAKVPVESTFKYAFIFSGIMCIALLIVTFYPPLTLWLIR